MHEGQHRALHRILFIKWTKSKQTTRAITSWLRMGPSELGMCLLHDLARVPECSMQFLCSQIAFATQRQFAPSSSAKTGFCEVKKERRTFSWVRAIVARQGVTFGVFYDARNERDDVVCYVSDMNCPFCGHTLVCNAFRGT